MYTELSVSATVRHPLTFSSHLLLINTRGLCRLLRHRLPISSQQLKNRTSREVDRDWSVVFMCIFAKTCESVQAVPLIQFRGYPRVFHFKFYIYL